MAKDMATVSPIIAVVVCSCGAEMFIRKNPHISQELVCCDCKQPIFSYASIYSLVSIDKPEAVVLPLQPLTSDKPFLTSCGISLAEDTRSCL